jgi:hypothetical protein
MSKVSEYIVGRECLKNIYLVYITGLMPSKIYKTFPQHIMSPSYLSSGPIGPAVVNDDIFKMPEKLDPSLWHPNYMRLHGWWEILDLDHGNYTSENNEVLLHPSQKYLGLSGWRSPCGCWSVDCCW